MSRYKNYEAGRLSGNLSRPETPKSQGQDFGGQYISDKSSTIVSKLGGKSYDISIAESQETFDLDHGMLPSLLV